MKERKFDIETYVDEAILEYFELKTKNPDFFKEAEASLNKCSGSTEDNKITGFNEFRIYEFQKVISLLEKVKKMVNSGTIGGIILIVSLFAIVIIRMLFFE